MDIITIAVISSRPGVLILSPSCGRNRRCAVVALDAEASSSDARNGRRPTRRRHLRPRLRRRARPHHCRPRIRRGRLSARRRHRNRPVARPVDASAHHYPRPSGPHRSQVEQPLQRRPQRRRRRHRPPSAGHQRQIDAETVVRM